ncbi:winged helix-turn-helix transcriptional regulator [Streptomyces goshikiensis]
MLSQNLKALDRARLVDRCVASTSPPQVTYGLTELGVSMAGPLTALIQWFGRHGYTLLASQEHYDSQQASPRAQRTPLTHTAGGVQGVSRADETPLSVGPKAASQRRWGPP